MWDDKSSTMVVVYRRYVTYVYLYETAHCHVTGGGNFYSRIVNDVMSIQSTAINDKTVVYYLTVIYMCFLFFFYSEPTIFHIL